MSHSYDGIVQQLDGPHRKEHASAILEALTNRGGHLVDWSIMKEKQIEAAMELMVLTHVAEGAVPLEEEVTIL